MTNYPKRIIIYAKDIVLLTGMSERSARRLLEKIRKHYERRAGALVSIEEFVAYSGLDEEKVRRFIH